jgi:hypothetical protein
VFGVLRWLDRGLIFKLEEEGMPALLLHLLKLIAETIDFSSAVGLGCRLVVATVQPTQLIKAFSTSSVAKGELGFSPVGLTWKPTCFINITALTFPYVPRPQNRNRRYTDRRRNRSSLSN